MKIKASLVIISLLFSFAIGHNKGKNESIDDETKQEIRSEVAVELWEAVDSCSSDICLEKFSKEIRMDIKAK